MQIVEPTIAPVTNTEAASSATQLGHHDDDCKHQYQLVCVDCGAPAKMMPFVEADVRRVVPNQQQYQYNNAAAAGERSSWLRRILLVAFIALVIGLMLGGSNQKQQKAKQSNYFKYGGGKTWKRKPGSQWFDKWMETMNPGGY